MQLDDFRRIAVLFDGLQRYAAPLSTVAEFGGSPKAFRRADRERLIRGHCVKQIHLGPGCARDLQPAFERCIPSIGKVRCY
jgi:hypothetical protein